MKCFACNGTGFDPDYFEEETCTICDGNGDIDGDAFVGEDDGYEDTCD